MARLLSGFLLAFAFLATQALADTAEAPVEHANPATVIAFLVFFIGSCVGYVAFTWWRGKRKKQHVAD